MPVELWGASDILTVGLPDRLWGNLLLLGYIVISGFLIVQYRADLRSLDGRGWRWLIGLGVAGFVAGQFLTYPVGQSSDGPVAYVALLTAVPLLFAAAILPPVAALWVGAAAGLGPTLAETHQLFSLFHYAFVAFFTAVLMQQNYIGRFYRWLREPIIAGVLGGLLLAALTGVGTFATGPATGLVALDVALVVAAASLWPRLLEGLVGGVVVMFVLRALPDLKPSRPLVPSPTQRSLQRRLTLNYIAFTALLLTLTLLVLYSVAITISTRLIAHNIAETLQVLPLDNPLPPAPDRSDPNKKQYHFARYDNADWSPTSAGLTALWLVQPENGAAYWQWSDDTDIAYDRELVVVAPQDGSAEVAVGSVPYTAVLEQAWGIGWPLLLVMLVAAGLFYAHVLVIGRDITTPLDEMVTASKTIAAGGNWTPASYLQRDDEIGQLQRAFAQMQRSMRKRLNELSLLLGVSHDVATSIDIHEGIPAILRGALRGTGAVGARAVVPNPSGGAPMTFGEGAAAEQMAVLDRQIMTRLRHASELMLVTPEEIRSALELPPTAELPVPALLAIPLRSHDRFQGILWLGFRQTHSFDLTERNLLSTLSTQGAVLVENARLYATAESGRRRLAAVLASTSDAVIVTDQTERVLLINPATERIFGFSVDAVRNRPVADVIPMPALVQALMGQDERPQNLELSINDGRIYNAIASTIFSHEGQVFGRVAVLRDITNLKEIDKMKSDFVATVSHDLRSPLTFIRGYASMLSLAGELTDKQHEYVSKILGGIDQMSKMVEDLLDIARIEGGMELDREEIEIRPLLADIAAEYWQHAHLAGIQIKVDISDDVSSIVGDLSLIRQAVANLVGNGVKYAPNSGPLVLQVHQANGEVVISVKDNGPGIAKEDQIHLFEKFYRVKARGTEKVKGSGLGLAIVKTIAHRHGGNAWVQSQPGKGSTFCISLPIHESEPSPTRE
ncbi:MAG: PAS domain-containing protein [Anaerolineae bacterium]|nr:PAS domain-containing protein [Anaerolineae bacterium]